MIREYINNVNATHDSWFASDPYYFVRIDSLNHGTNGIQKELISSFTAGDATEIIGSDNSGFKWVGLKNTSANSTITFTKSFTIPADGYYLIELFLLKKPTVTGSFDLSIAGSSVWSESGYNKWNDYGTVIRVPIQYLTSGSKSFVLTVPKYAAAGWIKIMKIDRYEGGKDLLDNSENRLDLINAEFTTNGVNELDTMTLTVAMKPDYWSEEKDNNPICFDFGDHITFTLGQDSRESRPMFGGYIAGWSLNDDLTELNLTCVDRLWDLKRAQIYKNFSIGYIPEGDSSGSMPFTQFPNVNEIARYLCTALYKIDYDGIIQEHILYNNFSLATDVSQLTSRGFDKKWETTFGHPGTCMRLIPTNIGENSIILFSDNGNTWNAAEFNMFNLDYYASGAGVKYPVRFNIEITMSKAGELASSAATYVIRFNGPTPTAGAKQIAQITPVLNGEWQNFVIDLKAAFDKVAGDTEYWIHSVKFVGYQDSYTVLNRRCSSIYIDHVMGFRNISQAPRYASADTKNALEELQDLCEKTNQVAYIRPGMERSEDQLIILPRRYYTLPLTIDNTNVLEINGLEYKPVEWGIINQTNDSYKYNETTSGFSKAWDIDSDKHYGVIMEHEFLSDVKTYADAQVVSKAKVEANSMFNPAFSALILGSVLLEPGQYINVRIPQYHLFGSYEIQAITHSINFVDEYFTSHIDFNKTSGKFCNMIKRLKKAERNMKWMRNSDVYSTVGSLAAGLETSLGAYS